LLFAGFDLLEIVAGCAADFYARRAHVDSAETQRSELSAVIGDGVLFTERLGWKELVFEVIAEVIAELGSSFASLLEVATDGENQAGDEDEAAEEEQVVCKVDHRILLLFFVFAELECTGGA
jgi:hypothetical protein